MSATRGLAKNAVFALSTVLVLPALVSFWVRRAVIGGNRALEGSSQSLGLIPGLLGENLRRAFLCRVLDHCDRSAVVSFGTLFSQTACRIDARAYVGPRCHLGRVHLEENVLLAAGVHIPSGPHTHGTKLGTPIREQPGSLRTVRIGAGAWIGSAAVVLADVGADTIVAAGAVVTQPLPDAVIAGGVPAKVIRRRDEEEPSPGPAAG